MILNPPPPKKLINKKQTKIIRIIVCNEIYNWKIIKFI